MVHANIRFKFHKTLLSQHLPKIKKWGPSYGPHDPEPSFLKALKTKKGKVLFWKGYGKGCALFEQPHAGFFAYCQECLFPQSQKALLWARSIWLTSRMLMWIRLSWNGSTAIYSSQVWDDQHALLKRDWNCTWARKGSVASLNSILLNLLCELSTMTVFCLELSLVAGNSGTHFFSL